MDIMFVGVCQGCHFVFEPHGTVYTDEIPLCSTCKRNGLFAGECEACGEYTVCYEGNGNCGDCGVAPTNWRLEVVR